MRRLALALLLTLPLATCSSASGDRRDGLAADRPAVTLEGGGAGQEAGKPAGDTAAPRVDGRRPVEAAAPYLHEDVSVQTVSGWINSGKAMTLLDVREPSEYQGGHLAGAQNLPYSSGVLQQQVSSLSKAKPVVVYCASGGRSNSAATFLASQGFKPVYDMQGGISAWVNAGLPTVK